MRAPRWWTALPALVLLLCAPLWAGDERNEVWTFFRGEERRAIVVTHLPEAGRTALKARLQAEGWVRRLVETENDLVDDEKREADRSTDRPAPAEAPMPDLRKDLEELIRGGGRLPEGFVPHGLRTGADPGHAFQPAGAALTGLARAAGTLIQRYLVVKADPVKGPVYEEVLGELAAVLIQVGAGEPIDPQQIGMRVLGRVLGGLADPEKAAVYREILQTVTGALAGSMAKPAAPRAFAPAPSRPPIAPPPGARLLPFGGATLRVERSLTGRWSAGLAGVPPGSLAAEMGLAVGDALLSVDGEPADPATLGAAERTLGKPGKLRLEVLRRDGRTEVLEIEFEATDGPGDDAPR